MAPPVLRIPVWQRAGTVCCMRLRRAPICLRAMIHAGATRLGLRQFTKLRSALQLLELVQKDQTGSDGIAMLCLKCRMRLLERRVLLLQCEMPLVQRGVCTGLFVAAASGQFARFGTGEPDGTVEWFAPWSVPHPLPRCLQGFAFQACGADAL